MWRENGGVKGGVAIPLITGEWPNYQFLKQLGGDSNESDLQ